MRPAAVLLPAVLLAAAPLAAAETVPVPAFRSVELRGGGDIVVRPGPAHVTIVQGSTQFTRFAVDGDGQLKIDACNANCPHHYELRIEISYPTVLPMGIKGGGKITVAPGFGRQHVVAAGVGGGGVIDLRAVAADTVAAGVNGGGKILLGSAGSIAAAVSGGGEIRYPGNPSVTRVVDGGGSIRRLD
jgi:hypothetical protein